MGLQDLKGKIKTDQDIINNNVIIDKDDNIETSSSTSTPFVIKKNNTKGKKAVTFYLTPEQIKFIEQLKKVSGMTKTDVMELIIKYAQDNLIIEE